MLTGKSPDLSKLWIFGSECYAYIHDHKKLDPRCERAIFVGYSKSSPAYLVYNPHTEKVSKHRLVKFIKKSPVEQTEQQKQTEEYNQEVQMYNYKTLREHNESTSEDEPVQDFEVDTDEQNSDTVETKGTQQQNQHDRYPKRETKPPK